MYVAIDTKRWCFIAAHDNFEVASLEAYRITNGVGVYDIVPNEGRSYSAYTMIQLTSLFRQLVEGGVPNYTYQQMIQAVKDAADRLPPVPTGLLALRIECERIAATLPPEQRPAPSVSPPTRRSPNKEGGSPPRKTNAPQTKWQRPKAGTATGRVWDICDEVLARTPDRNLALVKSEAARVGASEGLNPATIQVQFGKWKSSLSQ